MKKRVHILIFTAFLAAMSLDYSKADTIAYWPTFDQWNPITHNQLPYWDIQDDQNPSILDIVGSNSHKDFSSGYFYYAPNSVVSTPPVANAALMDAAATELNADALMFRMRVGGYSANPQHVWQFFLDTDGVSSDVEWVLQLDLSGVNELYLAKTAVGGGTIGQITIASNVWAATEADSFVKWSDPVNSKKPANPANSDFSKSSGSDVFLDFAIPWAIFTNATGVSDMGNIRVALTTSATHSGVNKDAPLGGDLSSNISDVLSDSIPEPAVATLIIGFGATLLVWRRFS